MGLPATEGDDDCKMRKKIKNNILEFVVMVRSLLSSAEFQNDPEGLSDIFFTRVLILIHWSNLSIIKVTFSLLKSDRKAVVIRKLCPTES